MARKLNDLLMNKGEQLEEIFAKEELPEEEERKSHLYEMLTTKIKGNL